MTARSKYRAVRPFSVDGIHFETGDPVDGRPLVVALAHGDSFVKADTARTRKAEAVDETTENTED